MDSFKEVTMKRTLYAILMLLVLAGLTKVSARDDAWEISLNANMQGKGGWFTCLGFARDLYERLDLAGGEAHLIIYEWTGEDRRTGRHAIVVYRDGKGRYWAMDAKSPRPRWVKGTTSQEWVTLFAHETENKILHHQTNPQLAGRTADLNRNQLVGMQ